MICNICGHNKKDHDEKRIDHPYCWECLKSIEYTPQRTIHPFMGNLDYIEYLVKEKNLI